MKRLMPLAGGTLLVINDFQDKITSAGGYLHVRCSRISGEGLS